jgi:hypothetical protein
MALRSSVFIMFLLAIVVGSLILVSPRDSGKAQSVPNVIEIDKDTTWTQTNAPYNLTGDVFVDNGVTLTIESGVFVDLHGYDLTVNGTLHAVGTSEANIVFNGATITLTQFASDWNEASEMGCIIAYASLVPTLIINNSPKIDNNYLGGRVDFWGNGTITNCEIDNRLNIVGGEGLIMNNTVTEGGIHTDTHVLNATISGNAITGCTQGIIVAADEPSISVPTSTSLIKDNLIANNTYGVAVISYSGSMFLNLIVQDNTITSNTYGIYLSSTAPATFASESFFDNNIYDNSNYNILSNVTCNVNAANNWWGTTDEQAINQTIYDFKNDPYWGNVSFTPALDSLNTQAPTYIHASAGDGGFIIPRGYVRVNYNSNLTFTISPNYGYKITALIVDDSMLPAASTYTFSNVQTPRSISATFALNSPPVPEFSALIIPPLLTLMLLITVAFRLRKRADKNGNSSK